MKDLEVRWIIEKDALSYTGRLVEYLKEKNVYYKETTYQEVISYKYDDKFGGLVDYEVATIFVGSLRLAKEINQYPLDPGAICTLKNFDCLNYYPSWNDYLLNKDWTITVPSILKRHCREGDTTKKFFFRPNEGDKTFTGGLFTKSELVKLGLEESKVIIQASKKDIGREWRFLVVDKTVIDGCKYDDGYSINKVHIAKEYLEKILTDDKLFLPGRAFTVDVGENLDTKELGIVELNSFSCANLYSMTMDKVVPAINDLVKDMYRENNE